MDVHSFSAIAPGLIPLFEDRPPGQIFIHAAIRVLALGAIIGIILLGRWFIQKRRGTK